MADNVAKYGFRWHGNLEGGCCPKALDYTVKSGFDFSTQAGGAVDLNIGDPVVLDTDGTVILATKGGSPGTAWGVVTGILNARVDANGYSRPSAFLPAGQTWSTEPLRSRVAVIPFGRNVWEIDGSQVFTGATTIADYRVLIGGNADFLYARDTTNPNRPKANPRLDLSGTPGSGTANLRIVGVSNTAENFDFSGKFVKLLVVLNETQEPPFVTTGI